MANLNKCYLIGNCTRNPEVRYTPKGTTVAELGLAINRVTGGGEDGQERREEVTFVDVTVWGKQAEVAEKYLAKGLPVCIEGRLQLDTWQDKDGQKRSKLKVVCEHLQLLGSGNGSRKDEPAEASKAEAPKAAAKVSKPRTQAPPAQRTQPTRDPDLDVEPDMVPF